MSRPQKPRYICHQPEHLVFGPKGKRANSQDRLNMLIDEFETVRLIDYLGYTQEEAAEQMQVARTTVQRIYNDARKKLAASLSRRKNYCYWKAAKSQCVMKIVINA